MAVPAELLQVVKRSLGITWDDEYTDASVGDWIEDGMAYIDDKLGAAGDYTVPGFPRQLLKEYVRYARDAALDVFENNYRALILGAQNQKAVTDYVECTEET